jgi:isorenieratene synthase
MRRGAPQVREKILAHLSPPRRIRFMDPHGEVNMVPRSHRTATPPTALAPAAAPGAEQRLLYLGRRPEGSRPPLWAAPDWVQANPARIRRALDASQALPGGGWFCVDAARAISTTPRRYDVAGRALVVWRDGAVLRAAPEACPHMGASLACARVEGDALVCPWHGLRLGPGGHGRWQPVKTFDDGALAWVQLDVGEPLTDRPVLAARPGVFIDAVIRREARCEPSDILANRLDPWHGAHFHPYAFAHLSVYHATDDALEMRVAYRVAGPVVVEVDARFATPDPRTIVMTIVGGEGKGSVVETHATPMGPGRTALIEATLATSERAGFRRARLVAPLVRRFMRAMASRLWQDDLAYAERLAELRRSGTE